MNFCIFLYIFFGILPSLTWLAYYLKKDLHPEPKRMILTIFLWGAAITLPVFFIQIGLAALLANINFSSFITSVIYWFIVISLTEEIFKYLVVKLKVLNSPHLDEPLDVMLYMVITALGFAALENILYLFSPVDQMTINDLIARTLIVSFIRFIGATFLHALCSAILGYFLALSFYEPKKKIKYIFYGLLLSVGLHGFYDFSIMTIDGFAKILIPVAILLVLAYMVITGFEKLKKIKSISKVETQKYKIT